jgi:hypothetical protein
MLLQWLVADGIQELNFAAAVRRTRQTSPDSPPLQAIQFRYALYIKTKKTNKIRQYEKNIFTFCSCMRPGVLC